MNKIRIKKICMFAATLTIMAAMLMSSFALLYAGAPASTQKNDTSIARKSGNDGLVEQRVESNTGAGNVVSSNAQEAIACGAIAGRVPHVLKTDTVLPSSVVKDKAVIEPGYLQKIYTAFKTYVCTPSVALVMGVATLIMLPNPCEDQKAEVKDTRNTSMPKNTGISVADFLKLTPQSKKIAFAKALHRGDVPIVKAALDNGFTPSMKDINTGRTLLMHAALLGHKEIVKVLLEKGAAVETCDNAGCTALHYAVHKDHKEIAQLLLDHAGKEINTQDVTGMTPLHVFAARHKIDDTLSGKQTSEVTEAVISSGAKNKIYAITEKEYKKIVQEFLVRDADCSLKTVDGYTAEALAIALNGNRIADDALFARVVEQDSDEDN